MTHRSRVPFASHPSSRHTSSRNVAATDASPAPTWRATLRRGAAAALAATILTACGDDDVVGPAAPPTAASGVVVLDGFIQPGLTLVSDSGGAISRIPFADPTAFDGAGFNRAGDTVVAASSRGAGDLLYVAALTGGAVRTIQMPSGSNPTTPRVLAAGGGATRIAVPLRDSQQVAIVRLAATGASTLEVVDDVGTCPVDAAEVEGALWVLDANADCRSDYRAIGDARVIRVDPDGAGRDTVPLPGLRGSGSSLHPLPGGDLLVFAGGDADFASFPFTLVSGPAVARVDVSGRRVSGVRTLPVGSYGSGATLGGDAVLHVAVFENLETFANRIVSLDPVTLSPVGERETGTDFARLRTAQDSAAACGGLTSDALGRRFCYENRAGSATFVLRFDALGALEQEFAAGQGGVAIGLR